jgi:EAL domain-containing protein (putative c-di-GMP-specific phosphodiesterase class I)
METVAEGIETQEQLAYLQAEGCSQGQGFLFARPIPLVELTDVLRARKLRG